MAVIVQVSDQGWPRAPSAAKPRVQPKRILGDQSAPATIRSGLQGRNRAQVRLTRSVRADATYRYSGLGHAAMGLVSNWFFKAGR